MAGGSGSYSIGPRQQNNKPIRPYSCGSEIFITDTYSHWRQNMLRAPFNIYRTACAIIMACCLCSVATAQAQSQSQPQTITVVMHVSLRSLDPIISTTEIVRDY